MFKNSLYALFNIFITSSFNKTKILLVCKIPEIKRAQNIFLKKNSNLLYMDFQNHKKKPFIFRYFYSKII